MFEREEGQCCKAASVCVRITGQQGVNAQGEDGRERRDMNVGSLVLELC